MGFLYHKKTDNHVNMIWEEAIRFVHNDRRQSVNLTFLYTISGLMKDGCSSGAYPIKMIRGRQMFYLQAVRPPLNKKLFPVHRPSGLKRANWNFYFHISKIFVFTFPSVHSSL